VSKVYVSPAHSKLSASAVPTPGPNAYTLAPALGNQPLGGKASQPAWVMGTAERFQGNTKLSDQNPGPGSYDLAVSVGSQASSTRVTEPMCGFGSANREQVALLYVSEEHNKSLHGIDSPGPMNYNLTAAIGRQCDSKKTSGATPVFTVSDRFAYEHPSRTDTSPGPGVYTIEPAVGRQASSTKASAPMPGFGTSNREQMNKIYISAEHEKSQSGNNSPGPCSYAVPDGNGKQHNAKHKSAPAFGFGSGSRWSVQSKEGVPGPGSYSI